MSNSSLSSVVSNLVRASMGTSVPSTVADGDLDRHVAELILKEAKQKAEKYAKEGIRAYLPQPDTNVPKTNKRFLSSIIRHTDDHNKTILRAQALAAQEVRAERLEQEKQERRARAEEAVEAERLRRLMGGSSRSRYRARDEQRDRKRRDRSWERRSEDGHDWDRKKGKDRQDDSKRDGDRHRRRHRSRSPRRDSESHHRSRRHRREKETDRSRARSPSDDGSVADEEKKKEKEKERYCDRHYHSRRTGRDSKRRRSRDRPRDGSLDRKRHRRSRSPSAARSDQEDDEDSKTHRSRHRKRHRTHSPAPSEGSVTASDNLTGHHRKSAKDNQGSRNLSGCEGVEESYLHSPAALSQHADISSTTPPRPSIHKDEANGTHFVPSEVPKPSSPKQRHLASTGSSQSYETPVAGPSSRLFPPPQHSSPSPSLSPGPRPPPPPTKSKSSSHRSRSSKAAPPPPSSSPPPLPAHLPSKMDRYFEESYDPRLDVAPLSAPTIPSTGLINDAEFAGWDAMLELIRQKRQDKEEKKRLERWGVDKDNTKKKKDSEPSSDAVDIMSIRYKKRGAVREWDLGKEGF